MLRSELLDLSPSRVEVVHVQVLLGALVQRRVCTQIHQPIDLPDEVLHGEGRAVRRGHGSRGLLELKERSQGGGGDAAEVSIGQNKRIQGRFRLAPYLL